MEFLSVWKLRHNKRYLCCDGTSSANSIVYKIQPLVSHQSDNSIRYHFICATLSLQPNDTDALAPHNVGAWTTCQVSWTFVCCFVGTCAPIFSTTSCLTLTLTRPSPTRILEDNYIKSSALHLIIIVHRRSTPRAVGAALALLRDHGKRFVLLAERLGTPSTAIDPSNRKAKCQKAKV